MPVHLEETPSSPPKGLFRSPGHPLNGFVGVSERHANSVCDEFEAIHWRRELHLFELEHWIDGVEACPRCKLATAHYVRLFSEE
jgi:hypothetical protein